MFGVLGPKFKAFVRGTHLFSLRRRERKLRGHDESSGKRFEKDKKMLLPLPAVPYEACEKRTGHLNVTGAIPGQRLLGAGRVGPPQGAGERVRAGSVDLRGQ